MTDHPTEMDQQAVLSHGISHLTSLLESLESSYPGMVPMFYHTGSYMGDKCEANRIRRMLGQPRPQEIEDRMTQWEEDFQRQVEESNAAFLAEQERKANRWWVRMWRRFWYA